MMHVRNLLSLFLTFLPAGMVFIGCMLALGTYEMDLWSVAAVAGGCLLYRPCMFAASRLWMD